MEAVPGVRRIAVLIDPANNRPEEVQALRDGARARSVELVVFSAGAPDQIAPTIDKAKASGATALNVLATPLFPLTAVLSSTRQLRHAFRQFMHGPNSGRRRSHGYGPSLTTIYRQIARQLVKVLRE